MKIGTKIRTLYQFSETGTIVKPRTKRGEGTGGMPGWHMVQFDFDGGRAVIHENMMVVRND